MGTYVVTGAASGMGRATADRLRADGHEVIGVDLAGAEVSADLSTPGGRAACVAEVLDLCDGSLDGAVAAAGLGGVPGRDRLIMAVNMLGVCEVLEALQPALARAGSAKVVVVSSNSTTLTPLVPAALVRALLARDLDRAMRVLRIFGKRSAPFAYAGSKLAVARWVRRTAVRDDWAGAGIRLNAIAPGIVQTPLLDEQIAAGEKDAVEGLPVPVRRRGTAGEMAEWITFLLSPAADFLCGAVVFVDGGTDAYFRPDDWPASSGPAGVSNYLRRTRAWRASRARDHSLA
ncbi:MAG: SDR family oxidoreductase [Demequina sp.]